jgi:hypothetical protein
MHVGGTHQSKNVLAHFAEASGTGRSVVGLGKELPLYRHAALLRRTVGVVWRLDVDDWS